MPDDPLRELRCGLRSLAKSRGFTAIAILTVANEELRLVRVGDRLPGGYRVEEVTLRSVTFADETGRGWRLDLPP